MAVATSPVIREALQSDVPRIVAMFGEFVASTQYAQYVGNDPTFCEQAMIRFMQSDDAALFVVDSGDGLVGHSVIGMLGMMCFQQPFSGETVASELFWWLDPNHRGHGGWLLKRGEKWARAKGATRINMMAPIDKPRVAETYAALGYSACETVFQKDL